jgi:hypothetical protein
MIKKSIYVGGAIHAFVLGKIAAIGLVHWTSRLTL